MKGNIAQNYKSPVHCFIPDCEGDKKRMWRQMGQLYLCIVFRILCFVFVFVFVFCICICILCLCFIPDCEGDKKRMWRQMGQKRPLCSIFIQTIRLVAMIGTQPLSPFLYPSILNLSSDKKCNFHISTFLVSIHRKRWGLYIEG